MATQSVNITIGQSTGNGQFSINEAANAGDVATSFSAYDTLATTMASTMATLVADGAAPTQAHVTAANNAYTALAASYASLKAQVNGRDFMVIVNLAKITSKNALLAVWNAALNIFSGSGTVAGS